VGAETIEQVWKERAAKKLATDGNGAATSGTKVAAGAHL
jgi:hypothetical protein